MFREKNTFIIDRTSATKVIANNSRKNSASEKNSHVTSENCPNTTVVYWCSNDELYEKKSIIATIIAILFGLIKNLRMSSTLKKNTIKIIKLITKKNRKVSAKKRYILAEDPESFKAALCSFVKRKENKREVSVVTDISTGFVANAI